MKLPAAILAIGLGLMVSSVLAQPPKSSGFSKSLQLQGIKFQVSCPNAGSVNLLQIQPTGRITHREPIQQEIFGTVTGAEIADLNADGWPEVYVYVNSAGSGSYGTVVGYAVNRGKSATPIFLPDLTDDPVGSKGYRGHDDFAVVERTLARRFPIYKEGDTNSTPTGGQRQLAYRLTAGEAGWVLQLDKAKTQEQ